MKINTKASIRNFYIRTIDFAKGIRFAKNKNLCTDSWSNCIEVCQPFRQNETLENKKHNLREASKCINNVVIRPGEIFSFWHLIGNPNDCQRFKEGRSIHGGVLSKDMGGGLCQASGIIHHLALLAKLEIIERYQHSVDLYDDETRFAPLGTDATVFYGFKDFRLRNNLPYPISFQLIIEDDQLRAIIRSQKPFTPQELHYAITTDSKQRKHVHIFNEQNQTISFSVYNPKTSII